jgi:hypothetical protein
MDKKSKIFFAVMGILIIASVGATYWRIMVKKDYIVEAQTDCDPYADECFIWECDPESDVEGEACTGDPEMDSWYFQVIRRNAANVPLCDPNIDEECEALVCGENEPECEYIFCTEENMEEQYAVACNDPEQYALDNPEEEDYVCDLENEEDCVAPEEGDEGSMEEEAGIEEEATPETGDEAAGTKEEMSDCDPELEDCAENIESQQEICEDTGEVCPL